MQDFVHLHVHTYYSLLDGQSSIPQLVDKALADGMRGMAVTDHGNMYGIKELFDYCSGVNRRRAAEGLAPFKPICGCEVYVAHRSKSQREHEKGDMGGYHLIILAKNLTGYHNLVQIVSRAWVDGFYMRPRTDRADLEQFHEGLIVCSACLAGEVPRKLYADDLAGAREAIEWYKGVFGDDYYLELQRHEVSDPSIRANRDTFPRQQKVNALLLSLAEEYGLKVVCTNDCHFTDEGDAEAHDHLLCISTKKDLDDPTRMLYSKHEWFKTRGEMCALFADVPAAIETTIEILDKVEIYDINHDPIMPFFPIPPSFGTEEEWRTKFTQDDLYKEFTSDENGQNTLPAEQGQEKIAKLGGYDKLYRIKFEADYLAHLAYAGAKRLYGDPLSEEVLARLRYELHVMKTMGFPGYFLIVQDFINTARQELDVWVGPGRGSAAGSVVAYCLGITRLDPFKYNLLFERFLNPDRISLPDIDTDFEDAGRGRVLQWVMEKYGAANCAHIITYGRMKARNALSDVGRVEHVPYDVVKGWCKALPDTLPSGEEVTLRKALSRVPELAAAAASSDERYRATINYAQQLEGTVRNAGIHACGFIISRDPIVAHVPISTAVDPFFPDQKTMVTQYDCNVIESTGLIKMDFLGLSTLSEIKETVRNVRLTRGIDVDIDNVPLDDAATYELYQRGETIGTFQFESPGMQKYLIQLHPTCFEDLIAMNALYRPGPMDYIPSFIARKNGQEPITYDLPIMEQYLRETYGITVYQEQVMLLSRLLAGFTRGESDTLRKAMGKKKKAIVDAMKPQFIAGGRRNGHSEKVLNKIWADWERFASYAFNKSHAACYSYVAYQTAYLKAHYPAEFLAAILTCRDDDMSKLTKILEECRRMNIEVLGPDINESASAFAVTPRGAIRFALAAIKGMGSASADAICAERDKGGPFTDIFNFVTRCPLTALSRKALEALTLSGAFDTFGIPREQLMAPLGGGDDIFLDSLLRYAQAYQRVASDAEQSLFSLDIMTDAIHTPPLPTVFARMSSLVRLEREKSVIGIFLSAHPLDDYSMLVSACANTPCSELGQRDVLIARGRLRIVGIITSIDRRISRTGRGYTIVTLADYSGSGEISLSADTAGADLLDRMVVNTAVLIEGEYVRRYASSDYVSFSLLAVTALDEVARQCVLTLNVDTAALDGGVVEALCAALREHKGSVAVRMRLHDPEGDVLVASRTLAVAPSKALSTELESLNIPYSVMR